MKFNSPFFIFFLISLCCGCANESQKKNTSEATVYVALEKITTDTSFSSKNQHSQKAIQIALRTNNSQLLYDATLSRLDYLITPYQLDSIPNYHEKLLQIATKTADPIVSTAYILSRKAEYEYYLAQYPQSFGNFATSKKLYEQESDSLRAGFNLLRMAQIQQIYSDFSGSEETLTDALVFLGKSTDANNYIREANNMLGISYTGLKEYNEAIKYYKKAKEITDDPISQKIIDNNIALCYLEEEKYDQAIKKFTELYKDNIVKKDILTLAKVADNLGYSKFKSDGSSGRDLMEEALAIRTKQEDKKGMVYSYLNLANFHKSKNPKLTADYAQKAYALATKIGAIDHRLQALVILSTIGIEGYNEQYFQLNDSVDNLRLKAKNHFAKMRFDASKEREDNVAYRIKQAEDKTRNLIAGIIMGSFVVFALFLFFLWNIRHKREKQKQKQEDEYRTETRIAKKLHDELANDIFNTMTFAEYKDLESPENKETLLDSLDKIYAQTRNISKENNTIDTGEKYLNYLKEMISGYGSSEVNIIINEIETIEWMAIESSKKIILYRVLQELMVNMKKHSQASVVLIGFKKINKKIQINYSDNGVGMGPQEHLRKNGLQNVENRIQSINGRITFDPAPQKGLKIHFSFNA